MTDIVYESWRSGEYSRLARDVFGIRRNPRRGLRIVLTAQNDNKLPGRRIDFEYPCAFHRIDEGYQLADIATGAALIYRGRHSSYLKRFREKAAGKCERLPTRAQGLGGSASVYEQLSTANRRRARCAEFQLVGGMLPLAGAI